MIDSRHFTELLAYDLIEALPDPWMQAGQVAASVVNSQRTKGKPIEAADFIPRKPRRAAQLSQDQQIACLKASVASANRKHKTHD